MKKRPYKTLYDLKMEIIYKECFSYSKWRVRRDGITLSIKVKDYLTLRFKHGIEKSYEALYHHHHQGERDKYWPIKSDRSMREQYVCHAKYAIGKYHWNLEPWKGEGASLCNLCNSERKKRARRFYSLIYIIKGLKK